MSDHVVVWVGFNLFVLAMLALDLGVFHRKAHAVTMREALVWSTVWIALALLFTVGVYVWRGPETALDFLTGYLLEKSLSVDNIFVFVLIFSAFRVPSQYQHTVLVWGIVGALLLRALLRRFLPITEHYEEGKFFVKRAGRYFATPLFIVLLVVETTDVLFAVDSIPAVLAITTDPFIVYTSNVFAILGLRALYFAVAGLVHQFHYLHYGLAASWSSWASRDAPGRCLQDTDWHRVRGDRRPGAPVRARLAGAPTSGAAPASPGRSTSGCHDGESIVAVGRCAQAWHVKGRRRRCRL